MSAPAIKVLPHAASLPPVMLFPSVLVCGILAAYLIGSIPFGLLLGKLFKVGDLRKIGSGNIGATNMLRAGGRNLAIATLALDMLKGFVAVTLCGSIAASYIGNKFTTGSDIKMDTGTFYYFFGLYAVIGHVWPIWLKGKGGKGVATALGVLLAFSPVVGMLTIAAWLAVFALLMYSSLAALVSISLAPIFCFYLIGKPAAFTAIIIALIVIYRHKDNIGRLINRTEPKSDLKKKKE